MCPTDLIGGETIEVSNVFIPLAPTPKVRPLVLLKNESDVE